MKKFGNMKKNLFICRNLFYEIRFAASYFVGNLILCKSKCCNTYDQQRKIFYAAFAYYSFRYRVGFHDS